MTVQFGNYQLVAMEEMMVNNANFYGNDVSGDKSTMFEEMCFKYPGIDHGHNI